MQSEKRRKFGPRVHFSLCIACFAFFILLSSPAQAFDGFVITRRSVGAERSYGNLVRYDLKDDQVTRTVTVYDKGDAGRAVIGPHGDRVAFVKKAGTIAVVPAGGGPVTDLVTVASVKELQWPAGEGGRWIYYLDQDPRGRLRHLRRVNVSDGKSELVVTLNAAPRGFALSQDVTRTSGHLVARLDDWPGVVGYDLNLGTGDLYQRLLDERASEPTLAPDGALYADVTADRAALRVADWNGRPRKLIRAASAKAEAFAAPRWAANAGEWLVAGVAKRTDNGSQFASMDAVVYDWSRGRPLRVTQNADGTFDEPQGLWVEGGTDFGLGNFEGEAPYTVSLARDGMHGEWEWDYGDGKSDRGATGRHTYAEAGTFTVRAKKGVTTVEGTVNVLDRAAPHVVSAQMLDERRVLVEFDEPVLADAERGKVESAAPDGVRRWALDPNRRLMTVELDKEPAGAVELTLSGFHDLAQSPNALADGKVNVERSDWPARRERLLFLWESAGSANATFDEASGQPVTHRLLRDGQAKFDRFGAMQLNGGRFRAPAEAAEAIAAGTGEAVTVEATIRPRDLEQAAPILSLAGDSAEPDLVLAQQGNRLTVRLATAEGNQRRLSAPLPAGTLTGDGAHHVVVTYAPGRLACYLDGRKVAESTDLRGDPAISGAPTLGPGWRGSVEALAIYGRAMNIDETAMNAAAVRKRLDARPKVPRLEVEAKLVATSTVPTFASVAPYREALVVYEYEVTRVLRGEHEGKTLRVAHFGLVNAQPTAIAKAQVGSTTRLTLEKYTDRPDLKGTLLSDTLPEDFDAVLYVEAE